MNLSLQLGLFFPLLGFLTLLFLNARIGRRTTHIIGCASILFSFISFVYLLINYNDPFDFSLFSWIPVKGIQAKFVLYLDPLSLLMALIVSGISFLIHVYSIGYMEHDEDIVRYFAFMNFFVFAMLLLVLAGDLLLLFAGWEGVGLASYLLIGYYYTRPAAASAAVKAFVMNRIGDAGFLIGLLLIFFTFGTSNIQDILSRNAPSLAVVSLITLLLFWGAIGKSAQIPLYTWLPDAMEGPTPVSALIHAATMVTAGVYLIVRLHSLFLLAPFTLQVVGIIGALTALFAALSACGQIDLKKVLAYSTVSQLGLMFAACGAGAFYAAMFHLTMHAFIKATLFLSAGNVVHAMHGSTNMEKMGGLSKILTKTHWLFLIGALSLSGFPLFAAFFSKDLILEQEYEGYKILFFLSLAASTLTGFYLIRAYCLTFLGKSKSHEEVKESPNTMLVPLYILGFLSIFGGYLGCTFCDTSILGDFLNWENDAYSSFSFDLETIMAIEFPLLGILLAFFMYTKFANKLGPTIPLLKNAFYIDQIYEALFVNPLKRFAKFLDQTVEIPFFEGMIGFFASFTNRIASSLAKWQNGEIRTYLAWMVIGTVFIIWMMT